MTDLDQSNALQAIILDHLGRKQPLHIIGGQSKGFYGRACDAAPVAVTAHRGITHYEPTELVITARAGTPLLEIEQTLAQQQQMLAFEPPHFGTTATLGGCVAAGLSGPRRPYAGALRDNVLGIQIINGRGENLHFGGEVMKNVAGYDVSRLVAGSMGTLGVILAASLKVLPKPELETTLCYAVSSDTALANMQQWAQQPLPLSASCFDGQHLYIRLAGSARVVAHTQQILGGDLVGNHHDLWQQLKEQTLPFFHNTSPLWRLSLPPATPPLTLSGAQLIEWGGAQRWLYSDAPAETIFATAHRLGGHASLFRHGEHRNDVFQPLHGKLKELHLNTKLAFDPHCIFNPGRMYSYY